MNTTKQEFLSWLSGRVSDTDLTNINKYYNLINALLKQNGVFKVPLTQVSETKEVEKALKQLSSTFGSKNLRVITHTLLCSYLDYLNSLNKKGDKELLELSERETNLKDTKEERPDESEPEEDWIKYDFSNSNRFIGTNPVYCRLDGEIIKENSWPRLLTKIVERELAKENPKLNNLCSKSLLPASRNPFFLKQKLNGLNCSKISNGCWLNLNYPIPKLLELIKSFCNYCGYSNDQIEIFGISKERTPAESTNKVKESDIDKVKKLETRILDAGLDGISIQELIKEKDLDLSAAKIKRTLEADKKIIAMPRGIYVHADNFVDLEEAEEKLKEILKSHFFQMEGYSNKELLFGAAQKELSMFLNDNDCRDSDSVYSLTKYLFEKKGSDLKISFSSNHIFDQKPDYPMTIRGLMINLARNNEGILSEAEAKDFLQKAKLSGGLGQVLKINTTSDFLTYDEETYLLSESIGIDQEWMQDVYHLIDDLFCQANVAYIIPRDITDSWFLSLPKLPNGLAWSRMLFQEVLDKFPEIGFKSISAGINQSHHTLAAAFVPRNSPLQTFPDIVALYISEHHDLPVQMSGEQLREELKEAGMLEASEMVRSLPKALNDYRFVWTDKNKTVKILKS